VRFSGTGRAVSPQEHGAWLAARLAQQQPRLWIGEVDEVPVGQVRLDVEGASGEVSIAVAPEARGRGHGQAMLRSLQAIAAADPEVDLVVALVHRDNAASLRLFAACEFEPAGTDGAVNRLTWPAVSPGA
jgi:UDP-2,4-diacetamido-2,4,6-trideoxy-beta-L-altropyranose hydrolase